MLLFLGLIIGLALSGHAWEEECEIHLKSGKTFEGVLLSDEDGVVTVKTQSDGVVELPRTFLRSVERDGYAGIFSTRFMFYGNDDRETWLKEKGAPYAKYSPKGKKGDEGLYVGVKRFHHLKSRNDLFLVGVVHIGEPAYYEKLQSILDSMDLVLYEGVGEGMTGDEDKMATLNAILKLQLWMKGALALTYQRDAMNYERNFWVNSDLSWTEIQQILEERDLELIPGEKIVTFLSKNLLRGMDPKKTNVSREKSMAFRRIAAPMIANSDSLFSGMKAKGFMEVTIGARNDRVVEDVGRELENSKDRWIAVFYGAGHMRDLEAKLLERYDLVFMGIERLKAWIIE